MKPLSKIILIIAICISSCNNSTNQNSEEETIQSSESVTSDEVIAIDILLDPDNAMLATSKVFNDQLRDNYAEGFELDASHQPHVTIIQAYVKKSALPEIEAELKTLISQSNLSEAELTANGLYYIPFDDKGLAGITVDKGNLMEFHNQVVDLMKKYTEPNGQGTAFVPQPDGTPIMDATVDYVNKFTQSSSGDKYNPHVTIGIGYKDYVSTYIIEKLDLTKNDLSFHICDIEHHAKGYHKRYSLTRYILGLFIDGSKFMNKPEGKWIPFNSFYVNGAAYGGLIGKPSAFMKYIQELLKEDSQLISNHYKKLLFEENSTINTRHSGMCLSWFKGALLGYDYYCHAGGGGGYYSEIRIYPSLNLGSIIFFNRTGMTDERFLNKPDEIYIQQIPNKG
ncbi:2'-5' RNA ligase family protein [Marinigracilibium pacificum]|uniref:Beta-lactamase family protein n=1 Tax=Marinigracilibium pacificum TaxID=2729599 RepID=A0A848J356_9BACT|nr:2'-5' RNA ligase family protein [Marinigracilibium pacificum]NMM47612.1 beta-lactamase family protein [Marinigracilibium pacificum]